MEQFYEVTSVKMLVTYTRFEKSADGEKNVMHVQTRVHEKLLTKEELVSEAQTRCDEGIVAVAGELLN